MVVGMRWITMLTSRRRMIIQLPAACHATVPDCDGDDGDDDEEGEEEEKEEEGCHM